MNLGDFFDLGRNIDTTIFIMLAIAGFAVLIVSFLLGEVLDVAGDFADFGDADGITDGLINLQTISAFFAGFGAVGWLLSGYWGVDPVISTLGGVGGGIPLAALVVAVGRLLARQAGSTNFTLDDLVGSEAVVSLRIAPGSVGYVEYRRAGGRHRAVARSNEGEVIPEGTVVRIERIVGNEVIVTRDAPASREVQTA